MATAKETESIYTALLNAQKEIPTIAKNSKAMYGSYANFDDIIKIVRPILNKYNLFLSQSTHTNIDNGVLCVGIETIITHTSGASIKSDPFIVPLTAEKGKSMAQVAGSILTYAKRYSLCAFLGIATGDDLDGNLSLNMPQQQQVILSPQLEEQARICASQGIQVYQAFYTSLNGADKKALQLSGLHNQLKNQAGGM